MTHRTGETACGQMQAWDAAGCQIGLAINVSARNLHEPRLADQLASQCRIAGIDPSRLTRELTGTAAVRDAVQMLDVLTRLRVKGFQLAIDDAPGHRARARTRHEGGGRRRGAGRGVLQHTGSTRYRTSGPWSPTLPTA